jgi:2-desacetyl-2-hydroxyethyl bacteriochlorophyllide A dehydrogenase
MRALFYLGKNNCAVQDAPMPQPGPGQVQIQVQYGGICGTDLSIMAGKHPRAKAPLIMGHEFAGVVSRSHSPGLEPGDPVVVEPLISCGHCYACRAGYAYVCQRLGLYGIDAPGGFAEYVTVAADKVFKVPPSLPLNVAALVEPVAVAVHAVRLSGLKYGDTVCVLGGGPIGLLIALVARQSGPAQVFICEKEPFRLEIARQYGLNVIDSARENPEAIIMEATAGKGADIVFEAAGAPETMLLAPRLCCVRGELIQVSMPKTPREMDIVSITFKELTLKGVRVYAPFDFARAIQFVTGSGLNLIPLLSTPVPLEAAPAAFARAAAGTDVMRVIFKVQ